jgi:P4 family phage/plasmid primase-like protien
MQQERPSNRSQQLEVDLNAASAFLQSLAEDSPVTFQFYRDRKREGDRFAGHFTAPLEEVAGRLTHLNSKEECGIFFMVNEGDGLGRSSENVTRVRALFIDLDGAPLEPVLCAPLSPHAIVNSSPGRYQVYWMIEGCPLNRFEGLQMALARKFDGDRSVRDLCRVMRLPGFYHQKKENEPFLVRVIEDDFFKAPYPLEVFLKAMNLQAIEREEVELKNAPLPPLPELFRKKLSYGERHQTLLRFAVKYAYQGMEAQEIYDRLRSININACIEPKPDHELEALVRAAVGYAKKGVDASFFFADGEDVIAQAELAAQEAQQALGRFEQYELKKPVVSSRYFLERHGWKLLSSQEQLFLYDVYERKWGYSSEGDIEGMLVRDVEEISPDLYRSMGTKFIADTRKFIKLELHSKSLLKALECDLWLDGRTGDFISLENGILDVNSGELLEHSSLWFSFTRLFFPYESTAQCPRFLGFLDSIWDGDQELITLLQLWMGYMLSGRMNLQKFAVLRGESRGGKGTLLRVMELIIGLDNVHSGALVDFGGDFGLEPVLGKKLLIFPDADKAAAGDRLVTATERIKNITGEDMVSINRKNKPQVSYRLPLKVVLTCNRIPPFANDNHALTNRMIVFPFDKTFHGREDLDLYDDLRKELPGIFNWSMVGLRRILRGERLEQSEKGKRALEEIMEELDSVLGFISESIRFNPMSTQRISFNSIWGAYTEWCRDSRRQAKSKQRFSKELTSALRARGIEPGKLNGNRVFDGIELLSEPMFDSGASQSRDEDVPF